MPIMIQNNLMYELIYSSGKVSLTLFNAKYANIKKNVRCERRCSDDLKT